MISKQQYEARIRQIFKLLLEGKTQEEIAQELHIGIRTVARYCQRIDQRYGQMQAQKTDDTLFTECQLFKNRLLKMYRILEQKALDPKTSGSEIAKCCEVASNIAIDVLRLEAQVIAVKNGLVPIAAAAAVRTANKNASSLNNLRDSNNEEYDKPDNNNSQHHYNQHQEQKEDDNKKF